MLSQEAQQQNFEQDECEFLTKLSKLVTDYRTEIPLGHMMGALEIVKSRLYYEANINMMEDMKHEKRTAQSYRRRELGPWSSTDEDGMSGAFSVPLPGYGHNVWAHCIVSDGAIPDPQYREYAGWEHVSLHIEEYGKERTPDWVEMVAIKQLFWEDEETVVQFHPPKSQYVNNHPCVLHLWRWTGGEFPTPPSILVGIKSLGEIKP